MKNYPVLYSFRRCPYAMRARMALYKANIICEHREVVLKDKPDAMLQLSDKGTVPVLLTPDKKVIEQSSEVMHWALEQNDPDSWLVEDAAQSQFLIDYNDNEFKYFLDRYKYYVGYPEHSQQYYRENAESFLKIIEKKLVENNAVTLLGERITLTDIAIFPFIRQFARVDFEWFQSSPYKSVINWMHNLEESELFKNCMKKYVQWLPEHNPVYFPA